MTDIYLKISKLSAKFKIIAFGLTTDENQIDNAVQELMLYFLQMNPESLKNIYIKDGIEGITKYGAVAMRRSLRSPRSPFFYKYKKYYTHIDSNIYSHTSSDNDDFFISDGCSYKNILNIPNMEEDNYQWKNLEKIDHHLDSLNWYDRELFKLYYYEGNTLDSLAKKTRISRNSLFTTIDKVRTILKIKLGE